MPYNIPSKYGGDSKQNTEWMEKCIGEIKGINKRTHKPYTESEKIAICKAMLMNKKSQSEAENLINGLIDMCITKVMRKGKTFVQAEQEVLALAERYGFDFKYIYNNLI